MLSQVTTVTHYTPGALPERLPGAYSTMRAAVGQHDPFVTQHTQSLRSVAEGLTTNRWLTEGERS